MPHARSSWRPVLEGEWRERAMMTACELGDALIDPPPSDLLEGKTPEQVVVEEAGIARGRAGLALMFGDLHRATGDARYRGAALAHLDRAIDALSEVEMEPGLFTGFTGVAFAAWQLRWLSGADTDAGADLDDANDELDDVLCEHVSRSPWTGHWDLISGLAGIGVYALERAPRKAAVTCAAHIVDHLDELATRTGDGVAWFTRPETLPEGTRKDYADGYYNLHAAHGSAGLIGFLAGCVSAGITPAKARELAEGAVRWMLAQELGPETGWRFPYFVGPSVLPERTRLAWCYGDIGIAATLLAAARRLGSRRLEGEAVRIGHAAARRPASGTGVVDACLCHGSGGLGHLFNRLHQATGEPAFAEASRRWYREALAFRKPGKGIAGYMTWKGGDSRRGSWIVHPGLLDGAGGTALAFLSGATDVEPTWDALLVSSIPSP